MSHSFRVFHKDTPILPIGEWPHGYWALKTCLRTILITENEQIPSVLKDFEVFSDERAYGFLLEVVCGMHSPMVGETEIFGQFKTFLNQNRAEFSSGLNQVMDNLLTEAKKIRFEYLQNLGCTSYGSLLRKNIGDKDTPIAILGAGSLTADLLPWLLKRKTKPEVFTRTPENYPDFETQWSGLTLSSLSDFSSHPPMQGLLIIAAGIETSVVNDLLKNHKFSGIFDLRGESSSDPIDGYHVVKLNDLFTDLQKNRQQVLEVKEKVTRVIDRNVQKFKLIEKQRPFGWEDLWTYS